MKRGYKRKPVVKDGELHIYWGKADQYSGEDIVYHNGPGTHHGDRSLLHSVMGAPTQHLNLDAPLCSQRLDWVTYSPSLWEELDKRGYDLTTLRFYIKKKATK